MEKKVIYGPGYSKAYADALSSDMDRKALPALDHKDLSERYQEDAPVLPKDQK